jgi:DMSO/TMAO reductase YedYZ molybdopterin-dependent catalytic subunit
MTQHTPDLITVTENPYNAETPLTALLQEVTSLEQIYVRNHFTVPDVDIDSWALDIAGDVKKPLSISYSELQSLPAKTLKVTLECAGNARKSVSPPPPGTLWGNGAVSVVEFSGVPLSNLLEKAGVSESTVEAVFLAADQGQVAPERQERFARSLPLEVARHPDTLLAWGMNGQPLTPDHGYPVRLVVPGWYGMASVKWLREVRLVSQPFKGFFQSEHYVYWSEKGTVDGEPVRNMRVRSLILSPEDGTELGSGQVEVIGIAWSGSGPVRQVEVSLDGCTHWHTVELESPPSPYGVQKWRYLWTPVSAGLHTLLCRAADAGGDVQPTSQRWNRLGYGNNAAHSVSISVSR